MQAKAPVRLVAASNAWVAPPSDLNSETALLGSLLLGNCKLEDVEDLVEQEMFVVRMHARTWQAIRGLASKDRSYGFREVLALLKTTDHSETELLEFVDIIKGGDWGMGSKPARQYAEAVRLAWLARRARDAATKLGAHADHARETLGEALEAASTSIREIAADMTPCAAGVGIKAAMLEFAQNLAKPATMGLSIGLPRANTLLGGLAPKQTTLIAARTSVGKSALSLQASLDDARAGHGVLYVSLEMTPQVLALRALSHLACVDGKRIRAKTLDQSQWARVVAASRELQELPIVLNASQSMTIVEIAALATETHRAMRRDGKALRLIVLDHVGLVKARADLAKANREQQVAEVSRTLRTLAERFDCHVLGCAQINRGAEQRQGDAKRPMLHDLRDSGALEQDADNIVLIHRPRDAQQMFLPVPAEVVVAKNRHDGELGVITCDFDGPTQTFRELHS